MKCPKCNQAINYLAKQCRYCGYSFGDGIFNKLLLYFDLRKEFENLKSTKIKLDDGVKNIGSKIQKFEEIIAFDITNAAEHSLKEKSIAPTPSSALSEVSGKDIKKVQVSESKREEKPKPRPPVEKKATDFELRLGQKWMLIIGIIIMVFGIGYFLKYSFDKGWIGPVGRVTLAYVWGFSFLFAGSWFNRKSFKIFGLNLIGGSVAVFYFATFAAFQIYHLIGQVPSFLIMILITVFACFLSLRYNTRWLAVLGLFGGFLTPLLLTTGIDNQVALMTYMIILNLGILGVAFYKRWAILNNLGFIFTYILYAGWFFSYYAVSKFWPSIIFLNMFFFIYSIIPFAYYYLKSHEEKLGGFGIIIPNAFVAFAFNCYMVTASYSLKWVSAVTLLNSLVFAAMAAVLYWKSRHQQKAAVILTAKSIFFLILTVPILFSRHWITIFWTIQAAVLFLAGLKIKSSKLVVSGNILFLLSIIKFVFLDYILIFHLGKYFTFFPAVISPYKYLLIERYITSGVLLASLLYAARRNKRMKTLGLLPEGLIQLHSHTCLFAGFGLLLFIILNVEVSSVFYNYLPNARFAAVSVLWALFSIGLMATGFRSNEKTLRKISICLFFITITKLFFFDMARFNTPYRIVSFIVLGLVLIGTSFLYYKFKDRIIDVIAEGEDKRGQRV